MGDPYLSVVVPCYNEEAGLAELHRRLTDVCRTVGRSYELVMVNDGSADGTWEHMRELSVNDPHIVAVDLSRNHGHELALTAGLNVCRGERVLILDADLQDPPELLPAMLTIMDRRRGCGLRAAPPPEGGNANEDLDVGKLLSRHGAPHGSRDPARYG